MICYTRGIIQEIKNYMNEEQMPEKKLIDDIGETKVLAAIGYISILCLVPLLLARESKYAQYHAKQGLVLFVVELVVMFVSMIFGWIPVIGWLAVFVMYISVLILAIVGIIKALQGEMWEMPLIGKYAKTLKF